jgi:GNAT superfamily N-acetyltransferase
MEKIEIKKIENKNEIPYALLLLADPSMEVIEEYATRGEVYGGFIGNSIIGAYVLIKTRPSTLELVNISICDEYQGKGIGKLLIYDAIDKAKIQKAKTLEVGTGNSSITQLAFYQKCGFRITGVDRDFFKKHYEEIIIENGIECVDMIRMSMEL